MKLISMTDFVLEQDEINGGFGQDEIDNVLEYANFLKQPLELGMFVPVDEDGNVMEEPHNFGLLHTYPTGDKLMDLSFELALKYQKAKEKVLFEGFEIRDKGNFYFIEEKKSCLYYRVLKKNSKATIEKLLVFNETILTESAIKQLGL